MSNDNTTILFLSPDVIRAAVRRDPIRWATRGHGPDERTPSLMIELFINLLRDGGIPTITEYIACATTTWSRSRLTDGERQRLQLTYAACCNGMNVAALCLQRGGVSRCRWAKLLDQRGHADVVVDRFDGVTVHVGLAMNSSAGRYFHERKMRRAHVDKAPEPDVMLWLDVRRNKEGTGMVWYDASDIEPIFTFGALERARESSNVYVERLRTIRPAQLNIFGEIEAKPSHRGHELMPGTKAAVADDIVTGQGLRGCTSTELASITGWSEGSASGRLGELKAWGHVRRTDARRSDKSVYISTSIIRKVNS